MRKFFRLAFLSLYPVSLASFHTICSSNSRVQDLFFERFSHDLHINSKFARKLEEVSTSNYLEQAEEMGFHRKYALCDGMLNINF